VFVSCRDSGLKYLSADLAADALILSAELYLRARKAPSKRDVVSRKTNLVEILFP